MQAKSKERKRQKVAEQAWQEEKAWLEAKRVEREWTEAERAVHEAKEERCKAKEEREAKQKCKAEAGKGDKASASSSEASKVKKVVMDPGCTHCAQAQVVCKFLMDGNKKCIACVRCNQSKGKCQWPRDGKDAKAGPKVAGKVNKGKKWKVNEENAEARPSKQKQVKMSMKLTEVLDLNEPEASGRLIANNLASLFKLHETTIENSGQIANTLKSILDESYGFRVVVTPSDLGSSNLNLDELHEEVEWLQAKEGGAKGEDENMAEACYVTRPKQQGLL
ncbi:hypothetical protein BKA82DRAFT_30462 [Pisolithus tinctorius]|uniref:Uncharacterized protein n=1 Tax=Pisolithus tinctorius Marx 270 TaxID=870435 RepID=A0A0C3IR62_PISTI|nr:hypothetical protein BKA82DRAFT_30462 [Pisolithus tinctorius]KIN99402.1 hypothetical protein M404DRAFT_30462 [Pisolithus tinctorius Marx 270]